MRVEGEIEGAGMPSLFRGKEPNELRIVVFREEEGESAGISYFQAAGCSTQSAIIQIVKAGGSQRALKYYREDDWYAPKRGLSPGKSIRIALALPLEDDLHVFPIEIPKEALGE